MKRRYASCTVLVPRRRCHSTTAAGRKALLHGSYAAACLPACLTAAARTVEDRKHLGAVVPGGVRQRGAPKRKAGGERADKQSEGRKIRNRPLAAEVIFPSWPDESTAGNRSAALQVLGRSAAMHTAMIQHTQHLLALGVVVQNTTLQRLSTA